MIQDLKTIYHLAKPIHGDTHAQRLEHFYAKQSEFYDNFREKLLAGRRNFFRQTNELQPKGVWIDFGAGTGSNLDFVSPEKLAEYQKIYLVDLSESLLEIAAKKIKDLKLTNVEIVHCGAEEFHPTTPVDLITFSYSLTMMPHWYDILDHAASLLSDTGYIGVVDFYVSEKFPLTGLKHHSRFTRHFWPFWFSHDNVFLNSDHLPYLLSRFSKIKLFEGQNSLPYLPVGQVPYYAFLGKKNHNQKLT